MTLQFHPLAFGVMLVVAAGTLVYTLWSTKRQQHQPHGSRGGNSSYHQDFDFNDYSSTRSSVLSEDEQRPSRRRRNSDRCAICLGSLRHSLRTLTCTHSFHENCITVWLIQNNTCPICRQLTT